MHLYTWFSILVPKTVLLDLKIITNFILTGGRFKGSFILFKMNNDQIEKTKLLKVKT